MAGYSWQKFYKDGSTITTLMPDNEPWYDKTYADHLQLLSFFGRINYTFKDTYLLTFTLRGDATSRFSKDHRWGTFPALALGWKIIPLNSFISQEECRYLHKSVLKTKRNNYEAKNLMEYMHYVPLFRNRVPGCEFR